MVLKQGESIFRDYIPKSRNILDSNWVGAWQFRDSAGVIAQFGIAALSADNRRLEFRIRFEETETLLGVYTLAFEISNSVTNFTYEVHETVTVLEQNIPNTFFVYSLTFSDTRNSFYLPFVG